MPNWLMLLTIAMVLLACVVAGVMMIFYLLFGGLDDMPEPGFDPFPKKQDTPGIWIWNYLRAFFGGGPRLLTYRRDRQGKFRKTRR